MSNLIIDETIVIPTPDVMFAPPKLVRETLHDIVNDNIDAVIDALQVTYDDQREDARTYYVRLPIADEVDYSDSKLRALGDALFEPLERSFLESILASSKRAGVIGWFRRVLGIEARAAIRTLKEHFEIIE